MKIQITMTDQDDGTVAFAVEAVEGNFAKEGETATNAEAMAAFILQQIQEITGREGPANQNEQDDQNAEA